MGDLLPGDVPDCREPGVGSLAQILIDRSAVHGVEPLKEDLLLRGITQFYSTPLAKQNLSGRESTQFLPTRSYPPAGCCPPAHTEPL